MNNKIEIYRLVDPVSLEEYNNNYRFTKYVGITSVGVYKRLYKHLEAARSGSPQIVYDWVRFLLEVGIEPTVDILEIVDYEIWEKRERYWITKLRTNGAPLLNESKGGKGHTCSVISNVRPDLKQILENNKLTAIELAKIKTTWHKRFWVYRLMDPPTSLTESETIRTHYIGGTSGSVEGRFDCHKSNAKHGNMLPVYQWFRDLNAQGKEPILEILEITDDLHWEEREKYWITEFEKNGANLFNITKGGKGRCGVPHSEKSKQQISESNKGKIFSEDHIKHLSESHKGYVPTEDTRKNISIAIQQVWERPGYKEHMSQTRLGTIQTEEHNRHISEGRLGMVFSDDHKQHLADAKLGCTLSKEHKNNIGASSKEMWQDPAYRAKQALYKEKQKEQTRLKKEAKAKNKIDTRVKKVKCMETGQIFPSATDASFSVGRGRNAVTNAIRRNTKAGGLSWEYIIEERVL